MRFLGLRRDVILWLISLPNAIVKQLIALKQHHLDFAEALASAALALTLLTQQDSKAF